MPDIQYTYNNIDFIWDELKAIKVYKDHKIHFYDAVTVFSDFLRVEELDYDHGEERFKTIGYAVVRGQPVLITVVYTVKGILIRIITAWKSTREEQEKYM